MKKLVLLLVSIALLLSLAACGDSKLPNDPGKVSDKVSGKIPDQDSEKEPEKEPESTPPEPEDEPNSGSPVEDEPKNDKITFTGFTVVDNDECMIKIKDIVPDDVWGYAIKAELENKSDEKTYWFIVDTAAINGVECDPFFAESVAPGKKSNAKITFYEDVLDDNDVGDYTDIELTFRVYDSDDWSAEDVAEETVHVYPYGEDKAVTFVREDLPTDQVIADNESVTVIVTGYTEDEYMGYTALLFLVNKTDKNLMFTVDDASVNGYMADPFFATSLSAGKCKFSSMSWSDSTLEENDITQVEEIEFTLRAYDYDNWYADDLCDELVVLNP